MSAVGNERLVVAVLRLLALSFAAVGVAFVAAPEAVSEAIASAGERIGEFAEPPETGLRLWLALSFAYMITIAAICLVAQADPVRFRPLLLILALAKAASSAAALGFFTFESNVFAYLVNFVVDGSLVAIALWLWVLIGGIRRPQAPD